MLGKGQPFYASIYDKWVDKYREMDYNIGEICAYESALNEVAEKYGVIWRDFK